MQKNARLAYIPQDANVISAGTRSREGRNTTFFYFYLHISAKNRIFARKFDVL